MAISTVDQKLAVMEWDNILEPGIVINETVPFSQGDKQQLLWGYPGVLWEELEEAEEVTGGGVAWDSGIRRPTKKEIEEERIRLGILSRPEIEVKRPKKAIKRLGSAEKIGKITKSATIKREIKHLRAKTAEAEARKEDIDTLLHMYLMLNVCLERQKQIEEQDIVFMMTLLAV